MDFRDFLRNNIDLEEKNTNVNQYPNDIEDLIRYKHILEQKIDELEKNIKENNNG